MKATPAGDAVEPDHRSGNVADSFVAFTWQEAEADREAMQTNQFQMVELLPDVWLDACRSFLREGLTYISLPKLDGDTGVTRAVRLADILATQTRLRANMATWTLSAGIEKSSKQPAETGVPSDHEDMGIGSQHQATCDDRPLIVKGAMERNDRHDLAVA